MNFNYSSKRGAQSSKEERSLPKEERSLPKEDNNKEVLPITYL